VYPAFVVVATIHGEMTLELLSLPDAIAVAFWTYNTRVVLLGTMLLGVCAGVVGAFMVLRKRALVGDVIGHAALPGIGLAFLIMEWGRPGSGRTISGLMAGAMVTGLLGAISALKMERSRRVRPDDALALVLSLFYGAGIVLFSMIQRIPTGNMAGLKDYLAGKPGSLMMADVLTFGVVSVVLLGVIAIFFKELLLTCFDSEYATAGGWPVRTLDALLIVLVAAVTVLGMQSVGLILVVSLLLTPASAARFWSDDIRKVVILSGLFGGVSAAVGALISAAWSHLGAGAMIVLSGVALFAISLVCGPRHGLLIRWRESRQLQDRIRRDDVLRAIYEIIELREDASADMLGVKFRSADVLKRHSWSENEQTLMFNAFFQQGLLKTDGHQWNLTERGWDEARKTVRLHRLWEIYLLESANTAEGHVDLHADVSEHFLDPDQLAELERRLAGRIPPGEVPTSPHRLAPESPPLPK
jgi:manganese/zinc/iron transport system permease protein